MGFNLRKIKLVILLLFFLVTSSFDAQDPKRQAAFSNLVCDVVEHIQTTYDLSPAWTGSSNLKESKEMNLGFFKRTPLSKDESRQLIVSAVNDVVKIISSNENARYYFLVYPDPLDHFSLSIVILNEDDSTTIHPEINSIGYIFRKIDYTTKNPENPHRSLQVSEEFLEEAKAIVETQKGAMR